MDDFFNGFVIGIICGLFIGGAIIVVNRESWKEAIISHGYAMYCPTDGHFAFKGECDK